MITGLFRLLELVVFFVGDGGEPFGGGLLAGKLKGEVCEPAVGCGSVPVFYVGGNVDDGAGLDFDCGFVFFLLPTVSCYADEHLASALRGVVDVPVITTAGFKGDVGDVHLFP